MLIDDPEAEGLMVRDVARVACFQEGGIPVRPGQLQAVHDQSGGLVEILHGNKRKVYPIDGHSLVRIFAGEDLLGILASAEGEPSWLSRNGATEEPGSRSNA